MRSLTLLLIAALGAALTSCTPTVQFTNDFSQFAVVKTIRQINDDQQCVYSGKDFRFMDWCGQLEIGDTVVVTTFVH